MIDQTLTERVYDLLLLLPRRDYRTPRVALPSCGVYVFFEQGETLTLRDKVVDRIVRVGTHNVDGNFPRRIRQHYGRVHSFGGSRSGSVFRKHLGGALLRRANPLDPRLDDWLAERGAFPDVEELVSRRLRETFTFSCFRVDSASDRLGLESVLIALLAQHPLGKPSPSWLGKCAASPIIARTGLWNTQRTSATPLTSSEFTRLDKLVRQTIAEGPRERLVVR